MSEDHNDPAGSSATRRPRVACICRFLVRPTKRSHRPALILCRATGGRSPF